MQTQSYKPFTYNSEIYVIISNGCFFFQDNYKNSERLRGRESERDIEGGDRELDTLSI